MKRRSTVLLLSISSVASICRAQEPPSQPMAQNIVAVSFNAAVLQTAEAQKELSALQTKFAPRQVQLQALNDEVEAMRKEMGNTADKVGDKEMTAREQSLDSKEKQLQRQAEDFRNDSQSESQQAFQRVAQKFYAFLQVYSRQHGYWAVIERGSDAAPVVWYAASNMDITNQLVKAYNAQSGAVSPGSSGAPDRGNPVKPPATLPDSPAPHR